MTFAPSGKKQIFLRISWPVFRHKIWHIRHGLTAIYQSEISCDGLTHQALAYIEGSQLVIFFPLTGFDRCRVVVLYKDLPLTDKKRRLFEKNAKQLPLKSTLPERKLKVWLFQCWFFARSWLCLWSPHSRFRWVSSLHNCHVSKKYWVRTAIFSGATMIITNRIPPPNVKGLYV